MMLIICISFIVLRSTPAFSNPTGCPSTSFNPAGDEQIDHTHFLFNDISSLYLSKRFSDVYVVVDNEEFDAHRVVLASRSEYFSKLLFGEHIESRETKVPIKEGSATSVKVLLKYIYSGRINLSDLESNVVLELLILSNVYQFSNLQFSLTEYLLSNTDVHNVSTLLAVALYYQIKELEIGSLNFIDFYVLDVLQSEDSLSLTTEAFQLILSRDTAYANELDIFHAVCRWIKKNQDQLQPDDKTNILSAVRYQLMDEEELSEVRRSELVCSDTIILNVIKSRKESLISALGNYRGKLEPNVNFAQGIKPSKINGGTMIMLHHPSNINYIEIMLRDEVLGSYLYYTYFIEVSMDQNSWLRVINHSNYNCRLVQRLWINRRFVRYIRIIGTNNTINKTFDILKVMYNTDKMHLVEIKNGLVAPKYNVALASMSATVIEGKSWNLRVQKNILLDGDYKNYDKNRGFMYHILEKEFLEVQLSQPYVLSSMRLLLWDCDSRTSYGYTVETSVDYKDWYMIVDKSNESARSWQLLKFDPRIIVYIRITGVRCSIKNEIYFKCVHLEAPAQVSLDSNVAPLQPKRRLFISRLLGRSKNHGKN
ncbi:BTB/POZ domain-containing protein 9-like isoform X2 [Adelges cooleyi]|uniref:BTB/POZ domain-containing protein 9-like isoform X2 n=1 Tax=Adelges cooleyi TaxID=133065 RepID=UPI00217FA652|nr:BTB/POZ domain-containing protein 9-like isoform X2 [Adelges cooleyi]